MKVLNSYAETPGALRGGVVAIGNFDGVHRGHQAVIGHTRAIAGAMAGGADGAPAGVMSFTPHPRAYFQPDKPLFLLTSDAQKIDLFAELGLDFMALIPFNAALAGLSADDFVRDVLVAGLGIRHVVIGYDFHFGKGRGGSPETMQTLGEALGFGVTIIAPEGDADDAYSSSRVRAQLREGDVAGAVAALGRSWSVRGIVERGAGRGKDLGFPTANLAMPAGSELLPGIYAVRVRCGDAVIDGAAYLGSRPTFDDGEIGLETFLFDFDDNLYGTGIEVAFVAFIRGDKAFASGDDLAVQMAKDCDAARRVLADIKSLPPGPDNL